MANTALSGLFGGSSELDVLDLMRREEEASSQQARAFPTSTASIAAAAQQEGKNALKKMFGGVAGGLGLDVAVDPRLAKARKRETDKREIMGILGEMASSGGGIDENEMMEGYSLLMRRGYPEEARKFLADAKMMVEMDRSKAAAAKDRQPTSATKLQKGSVWTVPVGDGSGKRKVLRGNVVFHPQKGEVLHNLDGSYSPLPEGAEKTVASIMSKATLNEKDFDKKATKIIETHGSLNRMIRYAKNIQEGGKGLKHMVNQFISSFKTAANKPLTPEQIAGYLQRGEMAALIGRFRVETLGPGVMTKKDAEMIADALGGDPSMWRSPQAVGYQLRNLFLDKMAFLKQDLATYNEQIKRPGRGSRKELKMPVFDMAPFDDLINPQTKKTKKKVDKYIRKVINGKVTYILNPQWKP